MTTQEKSFVIVDSLSLFNLVKNRYGSRKAYRLADYLDALMLSGISPDKYMLKIEDIYENLDRYMGGF